MFQTFISRHNSNFFSGKLVLTSVTPASSAPVLQTPKATSSTLYFDSLTVNAGNGGFLHCIQMDTSVNAANQVVSVGADILVNITSSVNSRERSGINTILHELNPLFTINVTMRDIKSKNVYSRVNSKATTQWRKTESANGVHLEGVASDNRSS